MLACWIADFACCLASFWVHFRPDVRCDPVVCIDLSRDPERVISKSALVHLNSSTKLKMGSLRLQCPYRAMLLRHFGTPYHFFTQELIILPIISSFVRGMSTVFRSQIRLGSKPNCRHQIFSFPGSMDLSVIPRPLLTSCFSCWIYSLSLRLASYHFLSLSIGLSSIAGMRSLLMRNLWSDSFPLKIEMLTYFTWMDWSSSWPIQCFGGVT